MMNNLKTLMLMALLGAIMIFIGGLVGGRTGMMFMLMISLGMNIFSYWFSDTMVLKMYGAQEVTREESPNLYDLVEQAGCQCRAADAEGLHHRFGCAECLCDRP
jgi:heat shock protein HtpX